MPSQFFKCIDCQDEFEFTEHEQEFYKEKNFSPPKRCKKCRALKKKRMADWERQKEEG